MTTMTAPSVQTGGSAPTNEAPISLFKLGCLFVIRASYWSCRISNDPEDFQLSPTEIESRAIASFGCKDLIDPTRGRIVFQQLERRARHELARFSRPFPAAGAHFTPWQHVPDLIDRLEVIQADFNAAVAMFIEQYPALRSEWQTEHPDVPDSAYPPASDLPRRFSLVWHTFKVAGASATAVDDIEAELAGRQLRTEQLNQMKSDLQSECRQFAAEYVVAFRKEVGDFCDQVVQAGGKVRSRTLQAIRRRIDAFGSMNVFNDSQAEAGLQQLRQKLFGITGETLKRQSDMAARLSEACKNLRQDLLDPDNISSLTGRLKRRVVLD